MGMFDNNFFEDCVYPKSPYYFFMQCIYSTFLATHTHYFMDMLVSDGLASECEFHRVTKRALSKRKS